MTETRFTWRWLLVIALVGLVAGLALGLIAGWIIIPNVSSSNIAGLSATSKNDYIVLVANTYANDQDLPKAKQRLAQLQDPKVQVQLERLAKALATRNDPSAANVADLAVAMGSQDSSLRVMAQQIANTSDAEPTKVARIEAADPPTKEPAATEEPADAPTVKPTRVKKNKQAPTAEPTEEAQPTDEPASDEPTEVPATARPKATAVPTEAPAAPALNPDFEPGYPALWWDDVRFVPAQVAPGQQYWRLRWAKYCDWTPNDSACPGMPGGGMDHSIYIMTVDESGNCVETDVTDIYNDGTSFPLQPDKIKTIPYAWNPYNLPCDKDYEKEMYGEGNDISVPGLPSDKITSLCLCNKTAYQGQNIQKGHAHVRYFLIFQRTTR